MGQGIALPNGPVYIAEIAPANIRGMMMSFWQSEPTMMPRLEIIVDP
jgi:hypothetical protein